MSLHTPIQSHSSFDLAAYSCPAISFGINGEIYGANEAFWQSLGYADAASITQKNYWEITEKGQKNREINEVLLKRYGYSKDFVNAAGTVISFTATAVLQYQVEQDSRKFDVYTVLFNAINQENDLARVEQTLRRQNALLLELGRNDAIDSGKSKEAFSAITEASTAGLNCARASVWLYGPDGKSIFCHDLFADGKHSDGFELFAKDFPGYFAALAEDRTISCDDAHTHPATREFSVVYLTPLGITSMLEAPIRNKGKLVGVLCNEHIGPMRCFSQEEQNYAASLADILGRVLASAERRQAEENLQEAHKALEKYAAELEDKVKERTRSIQLVLDSTGDGLLSCGLDGILSGEVSRSALGWFGALPSPESSGYPTLIWDYLFGDDEKMRARFEIGFVELAADVITFELAASQMPQRWKYRGKTFEFSYRPVYIDGTLQKILVVIQDATERVQAEEAEKEARELQAIIEQLLKDRDGFLLFKSGVEEIFAELRVLAKRSEEYALDKSQKYQEQQRSDLIYGVVAHAARPLHTLKGNTAIYGLTSLAQGCHTLEDAVSENPEAFTVAAVESLYEIWRHRIGRIATFIDVETVREIRIDPAEYDDFVQLLQHHQAATPIRDVAARWALPEAKTVLTRLVQRTGHIARSIGRRVEATLDISPEAARIPLHDAESFWSSLIHVVRNAVDHGIEVPNERVHAGKPAVGKIVFRAWVEQDQYCVAIDDDGRGIQWEQVRAAAQKRGLPTATQKDLENALFADGLSTRDEVTALSGRGVGTSAVVATVKSLGGTWSVASTVGAGTSFVFSLPIRRAPSFGSKNPAVQGAANDVMAEKNNKAA